MEARTIGERVAALGWMKSEVGRAADETHALIAAGRHVYGLFAADWAAVGLRSSDGTRLQLIALPRDGESVEKGSELPADGLALSAASAGSTLLDPDLATSPYRDLNGLSAAGMRTAMVVPMRSGEFNVGAMVLARRSSIEFDDDEALLAGQASAFLTSAIVNLRSIAGFQRAEEQCRVAELLLARRASELDLLHHLLGESDDHESDDHESDDNDRSDKGSLGHPHSGTLGELAERVAAGFLSLRGIDLCRVTEFDDIGSIRVVATAAEKGARFGDDGPVVHVSSPEGIAIATSEVALWRQPAAADREARSVLDSLGVTSLFAVPIIETGEAVGALTGASVGQNRFVTDEHITMATIVAKSLGVAMGQEREQLRRRRQQALAPARELATRLSS